MSYREKIERLAPQHDPRLIEAWMRLEHGTLDALSAEAFAAEVMMAVASIEADPKASEDLARSFGL